MERQKGHFSTDFPTILQEVGTEGSQPTKVVFTLYYLIIQQIPSSLHLKGRSTGRNSWPSQRSPVCVQHMCGGQKWASNISSLVTLHVLFLMNACLHVRMCIMYVPGAQRSEESVRSPGAKVTNGGKLPWKC